MGGWKATLSAAWKHLPPHLSCTRACEITKGGKSGPGGGGGLPLKYVKLKADDESLTQHDIKKAR